MRHKIIFLLSLLLFIQPTYVAANSDIWDLEMDFQYSECDDLEPYKKSLVIKLCNPYEETVFFTDAIKLGKPFYTVSYEIRSREVIPDFVNASFVQIGESVSLFEQIEQNRLTSGECQNYSFDPRASLSFHYRRKLDELRGRVGNSFVPKKYLEQDDFDALLPKSFRVHVTLMQDAKINAKSKGVTFRSDWYDINDLSCLK